MFEVNKGVFRPQGSAQLLPVYDLSLRLQEQAKHLERLFLNGHPNPGAEQFPAAQSGAVSRCSDRRRIDRIAHTAEVNWKSPHNPELRCLEV
jgi:hypothetical protein